MRASIGAYAEGIRRFKSDRAIGVDVITRYTKVDDQAILDETYSLVVGELEDVPLRLEPRGFQNVLDFSTNPEARTAKPDALMNLRLLRETEESGFFKAPR